MGDLWANVLWKYGGHFQRLSDKIYPPIPQLGMVEDATKL